MAENLDRMPRAMAGLLAVLTLAGIVFGAAGLHAAKPAATVLVTSRDIPAFTFFSNAVLDSTTQLAESYYTADSLEALQARHTAELIPAGRPISHKELLPSGLGWREGALIIVPDSSHHPLTPGEAAMLIIEVGPESSIPDSAPTARALDTEGEPLDILPGIDLPAGPARRSVRTIVVDNVLVVEERQFEVVVAVPTNQVEPLAPFMVGPYTLRILPYYPRREFTNGTRQPPRLVRQQ